MMKRGDILLVAGGAYSSKPRPVLLIQNHKIKTGESIIVIPFTTTENSGISTRISVSPTDENGLDRKCFLEVDKISAISKSFIGERIGTLEDEALNRVRSSVIDLIS